MAELQENAITKVSTTTGVDMKTAASTTLFTPPSGKSLIVSRIVVRSNSASLAGGTSYAWTNWRSGVDLSGMTTTTGSRTLLTIDNTTYVPVPALTAFQITVTTGSTAACTATIDVFGYLI